MTELEIGISYGQQLCRMAAACPDRVFVGVEVSTELAQRALKSVNAARLANAYVVNAEALHYMETSIPAGALAAIHVYFPTPNLRSIGIAGEGIGRRLVTARFVAQARRVLVVGGVFRLVTDCADYFEDACRHFGADEWWVVPFAPPVRCGPGCVVGTPVESRLRQDGCTAFNALQAIRL